MKQFNSDKLFAISNEVEFNCLALSAFEFQYHNNSVYKSFVNSLKTEISAIKNYRDIPFLPIELFKTHEVLSGQKTSNSVIFTSSSTTSQKPSQHIVTDISLYEKSFLKGFELFYGKPQEFTILALLPGYLEREGSSLVYMFNKLIALSKNEDSGFFLSNYDTLKQVITKLNISQKKTLLIGVTYSLLDLADQNVALGDNFIVMETGGMKGRRREMVKEELHAILKNKLHVKTIHSEYGMTELLSQAYSKGDGMFECPPWMKILIRDTDDPLSLVRENKTGGINVIDLANINSCSFIATQDLGRAGSNLFEVMGRFDNSDIRGCNLMVN